MGARMLIGALVLAAALASTASAQSPVLAPARVIDGPSSGIAGLSGLSVARDGSGGLVYLKQISGVPHVFVSRLVGGVFQTPQQVDATLPGASSQPVIAAANGGLLLIAFINAGQLDVVDRVSASAPYGAPAALFTGASNPALALTAFGKAYLAFTAAGAGGGDVRTAFYYNGRWALESAPLDAFPADDAGTGTGRPSVTAAGDGVAIVVWGEAGHVYSRRVWGTSPSVVFEQADVPSLSGWNAVSADEPSVGSGGDSSYADVVFHEVFSSGGQPQSRVLMRRLRASQYDPVTQPDGLTTPSADGADQPRIAISEYGEGLVTSALDGSSALLGMLVAQNGASGSVLRVDSLPNATAPYAVPGTAGTESDMVAWQHDPGPLGSPEIRARFFDGTTFGPELVTSSPALGPTAAAQGLAVAGDLGADVAIAWVQGTGSSTQIVTAQMFQPPGGFETLNSSAYVRTKEPRLAWTPSQARWGAVRYLVRVDGAQMAQTTNTSVRLPRPLPDGRHSWQVTAVNPAGLSAATPRARVFVDTVTPVARLSLSGALRVGSPLHIYVRYTDSPPPVRRANASGIAKVTVQWGDGSSSRIRHGKFHAYGRRGRYKLTVVVEDRAGNKTRVVRHLRIAG